FSPNLAPTTDAALQQQAREALAQVAPDVQAPEVPQADREMAALMDKPAPALEGSDWFNGDPQKVEQLKGKVVVLHFWAGFDDSIPGLRRLDEVRTLHALLRDLEDVIFIGVHDASGTAEDVLEYVNRYKVEFPTFRDA